MTTVSVEKPRKHRKTFTGCWTCRSRKVKCDEGKPSCVQCSSKNLQCEGYFVRLQWMPLDQGMGVCDHPRVKVQRSQIITEITSRPLDAYQIDDILDSIDGYTSATAASASKSPLFIHNFGVFETCTATSKPARDATSPKETPTLINQSPEPTLNTTISDHDDLFPDDFPSDVVSLLDTLEPSLFLDGGSAQMQEEYCSADLETSTSHKQIDVSETNACIPSRELQWHTINSTILTNPSSSNVSQQDQFLMYHYSQHAVNLFCVIDNHKTPWKTIHLPRALQSMGQLSISGSSSSIRNALRNALLSISAFCLSNECKAQHRTEEAIKWAQEAGKLQSKAHTSLNEAVDQSFENDNYPKYKEFLATMLSMISINVMSGDTSTCGMHLDSALRFMTQARVWKTKFSHKARCLHRIYFYLRVIYESTAVTRSSPSLRLALTVNQEKPKPLQLTAAETTDLGDMSLSAPPPTTSELKLHMSTYESIYGVPQALLILLHKTTGLIREVIAIRTEGALRVSNEVFIYCDELERTIMEWPIEEELKRCQSDATGPSYDIIRHTTLAFHNALIIYFAQNVRQLSFRYLQSYVVDVLGNMEAVEKIKAESGITAAPLYWPAFIAASEAFDANLQSRFKRWYESVKVYGIEAVRSGTNVLAEVWRRGPGMGEHMSSRWRTVVEETGVNLMLS
ncbi:fungal-specific transcription factor domain-containing protein [Stachybotrys elegans]|uniref:Fungal-specific transcription factor domain-containing protein n=1 Tax=Stachybotrys elegans TaxID=80388 RepID=A0A8K0SUV7_9HYPO|nr:fungal-specific transcription factor domain-containing protein [Stachybotrys elegans]